MTKFEIRVEGDFEYKMTDGPFTLEDLQRHWPEYLINFEPTFTLFLIDNEGNVLRAESGAAEDAMQRDWVVLDEWNGATKDTTADEGHEDAARLNALRGIN